jgi:polygalacturonase
MSAGNRRRFFGVAGAAGAFWAAAERSASAGRPAPKAPVAANAIGVYEVTRFGAVADGRTPCTDAIQKAIDACGAAGGGTVLVPPGQYASGALFLRSHVHLHLAAGAVILASQRPEDFPPIKGRDEGIERTVHSSLLTGVDLENVSVTGQGTLDGRGEPWVEAHEATLKMRLAAKLPREAENPSGSPLAWPRPRVINLIRCRDVLVDGLIIKDAPFYNLHLVYCQDVLVHGISTRQRLIAHHTAITVDSSKRIRISDCVLSQGGDGIGIKAGYNEDGRRVGIAAEDIIINNCHMSGYNDAGIAIGSETAGSIRNVAIDNCTIADCQNGVFIRSPRGRGGTVEQIRVSNLVMDRISEAAVKVTHFFDSVRMGVMKGGSARRDLEIARSRKVPVNEGTPTFRNFVFSGLTLGKVRDLAVIEGLPERFVRGVVLEDINAAQASAGVSCSLAAEIRIGNLTLDAVESAAIDAREVERLEVHRLSCARPRPETPAIWLENVAGAFIHGCSVGHPGAGYEWLRHEQCHSVTLAANDVPAPTDRKKP